MPARQRAHCSIAHAQVTIVCLRRRRRDHSASPLPRRRICLQRRAEPPPQPPCHRIRFRFWNANPRDSNRLHRQHPALGFIGSSPPSWCAPSMLFFAVIPLRAQRDKQTGEVKMEFAPSSAHRVVSATPALHKCSQCTLTFATSQGKAGHEHHCHRPEWLKEGKLLPLVRKTKEVTYSW